jgi:DNA-binding transcriptional regulator YdaS (Cro superfamily)
MVTSEHETTPAVLLLVQFLNQEKVSLTTAAAELGVSRQALTKWVSGLSRPERHRREAIERCSAGAVPVAAWRSTAERRALTRSARVLPQ